MKRKIFQLVVLMSLDADLFALCSGDFFCFHIFIFLYKSVSSDSDEGKDDLFTSTFSLKTLIYETNKGLMRKKNAQDDDCFRIDYAHLFRTLFSVFVS